MSERRKPLRSIEAVFLVLAAGAALLVQSIASAQAADDAAKNPAASPSPASAADEKAIRATADDFVKAFDHGDAKAIGGLWATDAEYTDESGRSLQGRTAIEKEYAGLFKEHRGTTMTVAIDSIRFLGPDIAIEKGIAKVTTPGEKTPTASRYTVVHARRDGKWIMVVGRDAPYVSASNEDYLKDLEWLIGDWKMEGKAQSLLVHFEWMAQRNFIKNTFTAIKDGKPTLTGGQIIGWNPKLGRIVSWHFGAEGGFGNDVWSKDGSKWVVEASGIMRDGSESSSVNVLTPLDANSFTWQSIKRTLDGVKLPDTPPVKIVRVQASK